MGFSFRERLGCMGTRNAALSAGFQRHCVSQVGTHRSSFQTSRFMITKLSQ